MIIDFGNVLNKIWYVCVIEEFLIGVLLIFVLGMICFELLGK